MKLRKIARNDTTKLKILYKEYLTSLDEYRGSPLHKKEEQKMINNILDLMTKRNFVFIGAFDNNKLVAFINASVHKLKPQDHLYTYINDLYVSEVARRKGIAGKLLDAVEAWSRTKKSIFIQLGSYIKNVAAIKTWEKYGFKKHMIEFKKDLN